MENKDEIIGVKMPPDKGMKLIRTIHESNRMVEVNASFYYEYVDFGGKAHRMKQNGVVKNINNYQIVSDVTINSITPIIPTYSVGDRVMILATGETAEIEEILDGRLQGDYNLKTYAVRSKIMLYPIRCHWSQICKLPI